MESEPEKQELPEGVPMPDGTLVLQIIQTPEGQISVQGPIHDLAKCYSMLELGRDAIHEFHMMQRAKAEGARLQAEAQAAAIRREIDGRGGPNGTPRILRP